ncbi:hypothetical protein [Carboxylicivirga sp. M1479]|uniref:hypothetical protein n=1 Tax=Carboxylicivirga sp. M1479 TaxID=2594476 RepID=UPI001178A622|nr:hypothetical protein [Carboxylicivirga sp. M1479]TRX72583.1 hypothetical protein FNN09_01200 [Carboxylicivirga sp. M1479]
MGWTRKLGKYKGDIFKAFEEHKFEERLKNLENREKTKPKNTNQGTTRQTTLATHYMRKAMRFPRTEGTHSVDAGFIQFLTGRNKDEIRKLLSNPLKRSDEKDGKATLALIKDLDVVKEQFQAIGFFDGVDLINDDIEVLQNDLKTFKEV